MKRPLLFALAISLAAATSLTAQLNVLSPDGGEQLISGSVISIVWGGVPSTLPVDIAFSTDRGNTWTTIAVGVTGYRHLWEVPPVRQGATCILRITTESEDSGQPKRIRTFSGHNKNVNTVDISPDNTHLVTGGADGKLIMWDMDQTDHVWNIQAHNGPIILARFSNSGELVATGSTDGTARIWNVTTGTMIHSLSAKKGIVWPVDFSADDEVLASGNDDGSISWWNVRTGTLIQTKKIHNEAVRYLEYSRDGSKIYASSTDGNATIIDAVTGDELDRYRHASGTASPVVNGIQATSDGSLVVTTGYDGWTRLWNGFSGDLIKSVRYHGDKEASEVRLSPDETLMASVGYNDTARILRTVPAGEIVFSIPTGAGGNIRSAFGPDGQLVAFSHFNGTASLWALPQGMYAESDREWRIEVCDNVLTGVHDAGSGVNVPLDIE